MAIGTVSCTVSMAVFIQKNLRKNPCSMYFIAVNLANLAFVYSLILMLTASAGFNFDLTSFSTAGCRLSIYCTFVIDALSSTYLILASIDRVLVTSLNARTRRRSTCKLSAAAIFLVTLFWVSFHIPALVFTDLIEIGPHVFMCLPTTSSYSSFVSYYLLIVKGILIPFLMAFFGGWTVKNIQSVRHRRTAPAISTTEVVTGANWSSMNPKDRQLVLMLLINVSIYVAFNLPLSIFAVYQQFEESTNPSFEQVQVLICIRLLVLFISYIPHCLDLYCNLIVSKSFRNEVKRLLYRG